MSVAAVLDAISTALVLTGIAFSIVGAIGLLRLPDFFARMHGGGVTDTLGAGLVLTGLMVEAGVTLATFKLLTILFFLVITSPTSAHALAKSALSHGLRPWTADVEDPPSTS